MSVIPERKDYKNIKSPVPENTVETLKKSGFQLVSTIKADEKSHFDRYGLVKSGKRVVVVYDVKAEMLSVTAFDEHIKEVCSAVDKAKVSTIDVNKKNDNVQSKTSQKKQPSDNSQQKQAAKQPKVVKKQAKTAESAKDNVISTKTQTPKNKQDSGKNQIQKSQNVKPVKESSGNVKNNPEPKKSAAKTEKKPTAEQKKSDKAKAQSIEKKTNSAPNSTEKTSARNDSKSDGKNDFTLKKYAPERFEVALNNLKTNKVKVKLKTTQGEGGETVKIYELSDAVNKLTARFMPEKQILQIQGKKTDFHLKIQTFFSEQVDFKSAVNAHIEHKKADQPAQNQSAPKKVDKSASEVEKRLKKYLPVGVNFLSSQAKIDFSIGIVDLLSGNIVLSDYSSLLIPPYRGLEKLIFDLQKAQSVKVKMIGQAFEKDDEGRYVLKASYRKRIGSIVYAEVMGALYTEYNSTRNFYVHSALGGQTKVINDKNLAISIYENMLAVVEYNAKKLKEIGFSMGELK